MAVIDTSPVDPSAPLAKKPVSFSNLAIGAGLNIFEVSSLGQPFEVLPCIEINALWNEPIETHIGRSSKPKWQRLEGTPCPRPSRQSGLVVVCGVSTKGSCPGDGLRPRQKAPCFSSRPRSSSTGFVPLDSLLPVLEF